MSSNRTRGPWALAIIGAGPTCTYAVERLAANLYSGLRFSELQVHIFDPSGEFGAGAVHSPSQSPTSPLNRITGQISFSADESNSATSALLPPTQRPDFHTWCRRRYDETGDDLFALAPEDWPQRRLHGMALCDQFASYVEVISSHQGATVFLHQALVCDVVLDGGRCLIKATKLGGPSPSFNGNEITVAVDHVLFATGHSHNEIRDPEAARLNDIARSGTFHYVHYPYPLHTQLAAFDSFEAGHTIGCRGLGLTAFDVILYLTEGRNGVFEENGDGGLIYRPSGREPLIVAFNRCGLFTAARPYNAKEEDIERYEHRGVFLREETIDRLRDTHGLRATGSDGPGRPQLDFERHVLPILVLEMRCLYYKVLLGEAFGAVLEQYVRPRFESFVSTRLPEHRDKGSARVFLDRAGAELIDRVFEIITAVQSGATLQDVEQQGAGLPTLEMIESYYVFLHGPSAQPEVRRALEDGAPLPEELRRRPSPWGHSLSVRHHRFSFDDLVTPIAAECCTDPDTYRRALCSFMRYDHLQAAQNNLANPTKAACDGVWRDLRQVLGYLIDFGGLTPSSHRRFLDEYLRIHNRLANGASIEVMRKMLALVEAGILEVATGPDPELILDEDGQVFVVGRRTGARYRLEGLIEARLHTFDIRRDASPLYRNMLASGLIRPFTNRSDDDVYVPGGVDITPEHYAIDMSGRVVPQLSFLGVPTEGALFYQIGAARPRQDHHVLNDVIRWFSGMLEQVPYTDEYDEAHHRATASDARFFVSHVEDRRKHPDR